MRPNRLDTILSILTSGSATVYTLASMLDCPEASIRRSIQQLRAEGHNIAFALSGEYFMRG
jgi:biotin operon repressor